MKKYMIMVALAILSSVAITGFAQPNPDVGGGPICVPGACF